jgi:SAM-dependent methyltransferase
LIAYLDDRVLLPFLYWRLLRREPDKAGRESYLRKLREGTITRRGVVGELRASVERHEHVRRLKAYRRARKRMIPVALRRFRRPADVLDVVFEAFLERPPTPAERHRWAAFLRRGPLRKRLRDLPHHVFNFSEFKSVHGLRHDPIWAIHDSRVEMVERCVPPAETIIDLGGASHGAHEGALLSMGYPYKPKRITIVDLHPDERMYIEGWSFRHGAETGRDFVTRDGIEVVYHYGSMSDLSAFADASTDLVFSGESIEHISQADAERVIAEAFRVLRPGGSFSLDTPNGAVTRLQSDELIHPEHQHEYCVGELRAKLTQAGFQIAAEWGVCAVPRSRATGVFDELELVEGKGLCEDPEDGYLFFIDARKPG